MRNGVLLAALLAALAVPARTTVDLSVSTAAAFSPDGNGARDRAVVVVALAEPATVTVTVLAADGSPVVILADAVAAGPPELRLSWDGRASGLPLPDGTYTIRAAASTADGGTATASTSTRIDTEAPRIGWADLDDHPGGSSLRTRIRLADASAMLEVSLELAAPDRTWVTGERSLRPGAPAVAWALERPGGGTLAPGVYRARLRAADPAGNRSATPAVPILVVHPVTVRVLRRVDRAGPLVALTFDDCNEGPAWTSILRTLAARHLWASFFCLGSEVARHPAQARRTLRARHTIGNHTWRHAYLPRLSAGAVRADLDRTTEAWWRLARAAPFPWFRPPYGALGPTVIAGIGAAGYRTVVLWDVDPQDWRRPGVDAIVAGAVGPARAGSIVLLHVLPQTAAALPRIISGLQAKGLRPVSLATLLATTAAPR